MTEARAELDASVRRTSGGRLLVGGTPPRLLRLSEAGGRALDAILAGAPRDAATSALALRLEAHGLIHPLPGEGADEPELTTIIPARDGGEPLVALVRALVAEGPVIVVDDGSVDGSGARAAAAGAQVIRCESAGAPAAGGARVIRHESMRAPAAAVAHVIRRESSRGPAAARNAGLRAARTELVAFLDADCTVAPGWRRGLAASLQADPRLALLAPRVRSASGHSALARYEGACSPLDLGPHSGLVGPGRRTSYLPSAALLARRSALLEVGGFDESMRFGEDVDLAWRLLAAGARVRYVASREVHHAPRSSPIALARQRFGYGAAAPDLARRHGRAAAPLVVGRSTLAVWAAALAPLVWPRGVGTLGAAFSPRAASSPRRAPGRSREDPPRQFAAPFIPRPPRRFAGFLGSAPPRLFAGPLGSGRPGRFAASHRPTPPGRSGAPRVAASLGFGALALAGSAALVASRGSDRDSRFALARLALRGNAAATGQLARALTREWLPPSLLAASLDRRARRVFLLAAAVELLPVARRASLSVGRPASGPREVGAAIALRALDHGAYAAGLWRATIRLRKPGALIPRGPASEVPPVDST